MLPTVVPLISKIVNLSLGEGIFAASWKSPIMRPLLKKLDLALINANYRPVSNLPFISKIVKRCMLLQLSHHCEEYNLQPDYQSAYRANYSCEMALLGISNDILWTQERQSIVSLVAIDLSAAFDTVDHDILLDILNNKFGVEDKALKWFDSYLRPHSYHVVIEGHRSKDINLTVSVPQGSCAGANIFNLYCAPLQDIIPSHLTISRFTDDHSIRDMFHAKDMI